MFRRAKRLSGVHRFCLSVTLLVCQLVCVCLSVSCGALMWEIDFCRSIPYYSDQTPLSNAKLCQVYIRWASSSFIHPSVALCLRLAVCPSARLPVLHENRKPGTSLRSSTGSWCAPTSSKYRPLERRRRHREGQKGRAKGGANGGTIRHSVCVCVNFPVQLGHWWADADFDGGGGGGSTFVHYFPDIWLVPLGLSMRSNRMVGMVVPNADPSWCQDWNRRPW